MRIAVLLLALAAAPFWEKPPEEWTEAQLAELMSDSPWARAEGYLSTAEPMRLAEEQWKARHLAKQLDAPEAVEDDFAEFLKADGGKHVVLTIRIEDMHQFALAKEIREMEKGSTLRVDKKKLKMVGHFPPTPSDPVLRMVFPRPEPGFKSLRFEVYLPGVSKPYRDLEFVASEMVFRGKLEY